MTAKAELKVVLERLSAWAEPCLSVIIIAAIMAMVVLSFRCGTDRGDDGKLALTGDGHFVYAVCNVLTSIKYEGRHFCSKQRDGRYVCSEQGRYVCSSGIQEQMQQVGLWNDEGTLGRIGKSAEQWREDTQFLNNALDRIYALKAPSEGTVNAYGWGGDVGYMDFVQFAFLLFGHTLQALYYGFFLLLAISAGLFCLQFWRHHFALFAVLAFAFGLLTYVRLMPSDGLDSVDNPRLLTVLALIPLFHALFLMLHRVRASLWPVVLFTPQAMLMAAAADFRSLAFASPLVLTVCCIVFLMSELLRHKGSLRQTLLLYWPACVVFACVGLSAVLQVEAADPRIAASGGMRFHTFWEPMYYDLQLDPRWKQEYAAEHHWATGDAVPQVAAELYEERHHLPHWTSQRGYETALRGAYIDFIRNDPWYVVGLKYYDAQMIINYVARVTATEWTSLTWPWLALAGFVAAALVLQIRRKQESVRTLTACTAALGFSAFLFAIPIWAIVVEDQIFADLILCTVVWTLTTALVALVAVAVFLSERVPRLGIGFGWLRR